MLRPLYEKWFRTEAIGLHNVPEVGGALVVANHSGTLPLDALMTAVALHDHHPARRHLRMLGADLMFKFPGVGPLARKQGATLACNPDAERLMSTGELVGVWPEGFKGIGKPFRDRYKLQRFGRGGFVAAALRTRVPIIPCSIVGAEEIYPKIGDIKPLARLLGAPYFPVTPTFPLLGPLGLVPLPSKWLIEFGEPIRTDTISATEADDPMTVFNLTDQVRETIQHTLYRLSVTAPKRVLRVDGSSIGVMALPYAHDIDITVRVNGRAVRAVVQPRTTLLDWLREEVGLTGTKKGCNEGACGTCTVLVDGQPHERLPDPGRAVRRPARSPPWKAWPTDGELSPVQQAFRDFDAFQCGYCTPGQLVSAMACIAEGHATDDGHRARVDERQHLPLLGLPADHRGRAGRRAEESGR